MHTALVTSSSVAGWIRELQSNVRFGVSGSLGGEEREALYHDLGGIAEKYIEDWESADDGDDD
jgi:hypothetical protein